MPKSYEFHPGEIAEPEIYPAGPPDSGTNNESGENGWEIKDLKELIVQDLGTMAEHVPDEELRAIVYKIMTDEVVLAHLKKLRERHAESYWHSLRVAHSALEFAADPYNGFSQAATEQVFKGALLHDVGKCNLPPEMLDNSDARPIDVTAIQRTHVSKGKRQISGTGVGQVVEDIVEGHHTVQRYAYGKESRDESTAGLIENVALSDNWDVMYNPRKYMSNKPLLSREEIVDRINNNFEGDPTKRDAFLHQFIPQFQDIEQWRATSRREAELQKEGTGEKPDLVTKAA